MVVVSQNACRKPLLKLGAKWREEYDMAGKKWRRPASVVGGGLEDPAWRYFATNTLLIPNKRREWQYEKAFPVINRRFRTVEILPRN